MKISRFLGIILIAILILLICLACVIAGWIWLDRESDVTPTPAVVRPTSTRPAVETMVVIPSSTPRPTSIPATPLPLPTFTFTPSPAPPLPSPSPMAVTITDPSLTDRESLERQFREAQIGQELILIVHDDHIEREIAAYLTTQSETPYRNVTVHFTPGLVELGGEVEVLGLWVPATVWGQLTVENCMPEAVITELEIGGFLTPKWAKDYVAGLVYGVLDRYPDDLAVCLTAIEVREGEATVKGLKR